MVAFKIRYKLDVTKIQLLVIVLCAIIVNANTLYNDFVYDDIAQIVNNPWITDTKYIPDIFWNDATHAETKGISNYYRPMMNVIYLINYHVFAGLKAWGFHLVNIILHVAVTILVFWVAALLVRNDKLTTENTFLSVPLVSALVFAVHPIHTEVIAWIACVPELSFTLFCLLSLYSHMKSTVIFDKGHVYSLIFFGISMLCKETTIALLPILAIYDSIYGKEKFNIRSSIMRYLSFIVIIGIYLILRFNALSGMAPSNRYQELSTFEVIINTVPLFSQYLEKLILPVNLNAFYVLHPVHSITDIVWLYSLVIVVAFIVLGYVLFKKCKSAFFGLIIITMPLLPVLYIRKLGENTFAERYAYFPSIGFALMLGLLSTMKIINNDYRRKTLSALLLLVVVVYSIGTINRNTVWRDEISLFSDTLQKSPESSFIHFAMGAAFADKGNLDGAINEYLKALRIDPRDSEVHYNLGLALAKKEIIDAAIMEFRMAITLNPNYAQAHNNLGVALARKGELDSAIKEYQVALTLNPDHAQAHNNLGNALAKKGNLDAAIREYQVALTINPKDLDTQRNLELILARKLSH
ncbi:tetratricopeptide repeat protein [Geobacter pelophilus]|uniref:Tetratricopeptide repeat protein n=1 Tax=Geoanaerobacter pelophilus TaxID=60036 RepID=A0AAW4L9H0_9BACT|nr:tetratricopeptide repeat protein [Geoanaerobacter pelophilus]MBT0664492.1 tetratricopeptide repeat protein [Geoanaerobacter pelophilus]